MTTKYGVNLCCVVCGKVNRSVMPAISLIAANEAVKEFRKGTRPANCDHCDSQLVYFPYTDEEE
ncbi:hypothetical protein D3C78_1391760 [compost metagenome]